MSNKQYHVQEIPLADITILDRVRQDVGNLDELKNSMAVSGLLNPIILDSDLQLVAGERRYRAAQLLEWETISARIIPGLTPDQKLAIELVENTARAPFHWAEETELRARVHAYHADTKSDWAYADTARLLGTSRNTIQKDVDLWVAIQTFPSLRNCDTKSKAKQQYNGLVKQAQDIEAAKLLDDNNDNILSVLQQAGVSIEDIPEGSESSAEDAAGTPVPSPKVPAATAPTFLYHHGNWDEVLTEFEDKTIGLMELDPPYAINYDTTYGQMSKTASRAKDWTPDQFQDAMSRLVEMSKYKLIPDSWVIVWVGYEWVEYTQQLFKKHGFRIQRPGIWYKPGGGGCNTVSTNLVSNYEFFLLMAWGKPRLNHMVNAAISAKNIAGSRKVHQWEKPIEGLYDVLIGATARPYTYFFSPFAGSGNSMVAAAKYHMRPCGADINAPHYLSTFKLRMHNLMEQSNDNQDNQASDEDSGSV